MLRVLFLIRRRNHPASRYRVLQFVDHLEASEIRCRVEEIPDSIREWRKVLRRSREVELVFVQKKRLSQLLLALLRRGTRKLLYDFDDAVMFASSRHGTHESPSRMKKFRRMVESSDGVIAGNRYLASLAEPFAKRVWVVPTSIELSRYRARPVEKNSDRLTLGWIGGRKSLPFLESLRPVLERVHKKHPSVELKIISKEFPEMGDIPVVRRAWSEATEAQEVSTFDVGLAPLPDDVWSRGKCATKLLQCMAAAVPCVASRVGVHEEIVRHGTNGFLASDPAKWERALDLLVTDRVLRERLGLEARRTVEQEYSVARQAPRLGEILREVARPSTRSRSSIGILAQDKASKVHFAEAPRIGKIRRLRKPSWIAPAVDLVDCGGQLAVRKDFSECHPIVRRTLAPFLVRHEQRILRRLGGVAGIPRVLGSVDSLAFLCEYIDGRAIHKLDRSEISVSFFDGLGKVLDEIHARGVVHLDLRQRKNILVSEDGMPHFLDFASAVAFRLGSVVERRLHGWGRLIDRAALIKFKTRYFPDRLTRQERLLADRMNRMKVLWFLRPLRRILRAPARWSSGVRARSGREGGGGRCCSVTS